MADFSLVNEVIGLRGDRIGRSSVIIFYCSRLDSLVLGLASIL